MEESEWETNMDHYRLLAHRWAEGTITEAERKQLESWYNTGQDDPSVLSTTPPLDEDRLRSEMFDAIRNRLGIEPGVMDPAFRTGSMIRWMAAAVFFIAISVTTFIFVKKDRRNKQPITTASLPVDVMPGHNGAVLHLSNGTTIVLDSVKNGIVASQGGLKIVKEDGMLKYTGSGSDPVYNTVVTDRGNQWNLVLPDGTKVWLNAKSSLRYPLVFAGDKRSVDLTGEGYFEVKHDSRHPFQVKSGDQIIEDVGTSFNVNAYPDEPGMKATLAEGAIRMKDIVLRPGQEAVVKGNKISVSPGNISQALAWKNGFFSFEHADIYEVMRQVSRWYKVDVTFEGNPASTHFEGEIGRSLTLSQLLKGLSDIHVRFRIEEGKRLVILP